MQTHAGEKAYSCEVCKSAFSQNALLKNHMQIHAGEKSFM